MGYRVNGEDRARRVVRSQEVVRALSQAGFSEEEAASGIGVSVKTLGRWARGETPLGAPKYEAAREMLASRGIAIPRAEIYMNATTFVIPQIAHAAEPAKAPEAPICKAATDFEAALDLVLDLPPDERRRLARLVLKIDGLPR